MNKDKFKTISDSITELNKEQRTTLLKKIQGLELVCERGQDSQKGNQFFRDLHQATCAVLELRGKKGPPWSSLVKHKDYRLYLQKAEAVEPFLQSVIPGDYDKSQRLSLYVGCLDCLVDFLLQAGIPVNFTTMMNAYHLLQDAVDEAYPDYLEAGLLHWIVEQSVSTAV